MVSPRKNFTKLAALGLGLALMVGVAACGDDGDATAGGKGGGTVNLTAYSTPQEVYTDGLIPAFQATTAGSGVEVRTSFGASGDQSRAVEAGQPTDFVHLPLEVDVTRLVDAGLVDPNYRDDEFKGSPQTSVVAIVTRPGNPKNIQGWDDLITGDVEVINANPFTSGGARWNVMAAYGQVIQTGGTETEALDYVSQLFENIPVQDASARDALNTFLTGKGDVLLSYENEAIAAQNAGEDVEYFVPDDTILIETLGAVTTDAANPAGAEAFQEFLYSTEAQQIWAEGGYRPVDPAVAKEYADKFPTPANLFTIEDFGGWATVATEFFDPENGSIAKIQSDLGNPTSK